MPGCVFTGGQVHVGDNSVVGVGASWPRIYLGAYAFGGKLYVKPSELEGFAANVPEARRKLSFLRMFPLASGP